MKKLLKKERKELELTLDKKKISYTSKQSKEDLVKLILSSKKEVKSGTIEDLKMRAKIEGEDVYVTATVGQIEQTFTVKMNYYRYHHKTVYSNTVKPEVNADIAPYISGITGLIVTLIAMRSGAYKLLSKRYTN